MVWFKRKRRQLKIRAAKRSDVLELCGQSYPESLKAIVVEEDEKPVAIAGVLHTEPPQCFSVMLDDARKSPKTIVRVGQQMRQLLDSYSVTVYAIADLRENDAPRFLRFMGFTYFKTTSQGELYRWQPQPLTL